MSKCTCPCSTSLAPYERSYAKGCWSAYQACSIRRNEKHECWRYGGFGKPKIWSLRRGCFYFFALVRTSAFLVKYLYFITFIQAKTTILHAGTNSYSSPVYWHFSNHQNCFLRLSTSKRFRHWNAYCYLLRVWSRDFAKNRWEGNFLNFLQMGWN